MRIVVAYPDPAIRSISRAALENLSGCDVAGSAADTDMALALVRVTKPGLLVTADEIHPAGAEELIAKAREIVPDLGVIVLMARGTTLDNSEMLRRYGFATAVIPVDSEGYPDNLRTALECVTGSALTSTPGFLTFPGSATPPNRGLERLTHREREVLELMAAGLSNAEIGHRLGITKKTVSKYLESIHQTLGVGGDRGRVTRVAAVLEYLRSIGRLRTI